MKRNLQRAISGALAAAMVAGSLVATTVPAAADKRRDAYIERYYDNHPRDDNYRRWQRDRRNWRDDDYRRWYRNNQRRDRNDTAAAAIFGLAAGAIAGGVVGGAMNNSAPVRGSGAPPAGGHAFGSQGYYAYCSSKYRSFDASSGTYVGYDGNRHYCQ
ncbi:BA14K family protein [Methylobrevis pamukkalensis]|uniref:Lectin-like protein BA14k n=1 Tax=Methylobrevis pamukkalensis TaxID=1439726 RepID=A0A1E3H0V1_9HYPH|nr:BA14K family protein [Methylobrevis pamukkalensis]ODN69201.1 BA14K-like protein [Methylobrevis pamukkalensis]